MLVADSRGGESQRGDTRRAQALPALKTAFEAARTEAPSRTENKPRYLRCNLLTTTRKEVRAKLAAEGVDAEDDAHVDDLLVTTAKVHGGHALVKAGEVILQDKSSCFPAHALLDGLPPDWRGARIHNIATPVRR